VTTYAEFLARKQRRAGHHGRPCRPNDVHSTLYAWQQDIVAWAVRKGRAAIWADTGLGKSFMQIEWARLSGDRALIVAPLAVCHQTVREAAKLGLTARYVREDDGEPGLMVTNYEMATRFDPAAIDAVVLDEASILKQSDGKMRTALIGHFAQVSARLACTATPAPNDPEELTNQAEFLGVMPRVEMLAAYFIHDDTGWRLKGHARGPMYQWMTSWAVALRRPSDIGYPDDGYDLPPLDIVPEVVHVDLPAPEGQLFAADLGGVGGRASVRKQTLAERVTRAVELVNESHAMKASGEACGSPNTRKRASSGTRQIPSTAPTDGPQAAHPSRTANTCATTTSSTLKSFGVHQSSSPSGTPGDVNATPKMPNTESGASGKRATLTPRDGETSGFAAPSASVRPSSTPSSNSRMAAAPSAPPRSEIGRAESLPLTTAIGPASFEASSVPNVTSALESSGTTRSFCVTPPSTSNDRFEPWVIWCGLNAEQDALAAAFGDRAFSISGSMLPDQKVDLLERWLTGERPILISKTSILGLGVNMQHCARMAFVGLGDSWEQYYQAIRRCWRYGQTRPVRAHVVLSALEGQIASNVARKEREVSRLIDGLVAAMRQEWRTAA
jgi:hypothetical protein